MATKAIDAKRREQLTKECMDLVLKRSGVTKRDIYKIAMHSFFVGNLDLLTSTERKKYASIL